MLFDNLVAFVSRFHYPALCREAPDLSEQHKEDALEESPAEILQGLFCYRAKGLFRRLEDG